MIEYQRPKSYETISTQQTIDEEKQKRLKCLLEDYQKAITEFNYTRDEVDRNRLERRLEVLKKEIESLQPEYDTRHEKDKRHEYLKSNLHLIDFKMIDRAVKKIIRSNEKYAAALLLLQKVPKDLGTFCTIRIKERLPRTWDYKPPWTVEFPVGSSYSEFIILNKLGKYLGVEPKNDLDEYSQAIIHRLCGSLRTGSVFLIEFKNWDYLYIQDLMHNSQDLMHNSQNLIHKRIFLWFLDFWQKILFELDLQTHRQITLIMLIFVEGPFPKNCYTDDCFCKISEFKKEKILEIKLRNWTKEEIACWIRSHAGKWLESNQIDSIVEKVYQQTKGSPDRTINALLSDLCGESNGESD